MSHVLNYLERSYKKDLLIGGLGLRTTSEVAHGAGVARSTAARHLAAYAESGEVQEYEERPALWLIAGQRQRDAIQWHRDQTSPNEKGTES